MYKFRLVDVPKEDLSVYIEYHHKIFPGSAFPQNAAVWYHSQLFTGQVRTYGIFDDDKLIATWSVEPRRLGDIPVGRVFATSVDPDYRRQGLFVQLSKFALENERSLQEYHHVVGFCQTGRPVIDGHLKAGWKHLQTIPMFSLLNSQIDVNSAHAAPANSPVYSFEDIKYPDYVGTFKDTPEFLNRKWVQCPSRSYNLITLPSKEGFVVLKVYKSMCHILDIRGDFDLLISVVKKLCKYHEWGEITTWCAENDSYISAIRQAEFSSGRSPLPSMEMITCPISSNIPLVFSSTHFQMGVEETY